MGASSAAKGCAAAVPVFTTWNDSAGFLRVQDQSVIPRRGREDFLRRELVRAVFADPALTDFERVSQRAAADRHGVAIFLPDLDRDLHD